jgi:hypothetical protein
MRSDNAATLARVRLLATRAMLNLAPPGSPQAAAIASPCGAAGDRASTLPAIPARPADSRNGRGTASPAPPMAPGGDAVPGVPYGPPDALAGLPASVRQIFASLPEDVQTALRRLFCTLLRVAPTSAAWKAQEPALVRLRDGSARVCPGRVAGNSGQVGYSFNRRAI